MTRRCAGAKWRLLVHDRLERKTGGLLYGDSHSIGSTRDLAGEDREFLHATVLPDTEFDEVVVGSFLHAEQMDAGDWWVNVSGVVINVHADRDGRPVRVMVELEPVEGVTYDLEL